MQYKLNSVIWGGLSPDLLSKIATYPELCQEAARVLESMYCASLPREMHARDLVDKEISRFYNSSLNFGKRKRSVKAMMIPPCPLKDRDNFEEFSQMSILRCGIHTHCMTCHKPPKGITGCRLCRPAGMKSSTSPVELVDITATEDGEERLQTKRQKTEITYEVIPQEEMMQFPTKHSESEIEVPDSRMIVWEIKRPVLSGLPVPASDDSVNSIDDHEEEKKCETTEESEALNGIEYDEKEKMWYINSLEKAMLGQVKDNYISGDDKGMYPPPDTVHRENFFCYDPPADGNCLFKSCCYSADKQNIASFKDYPTEGALRNGSMEYLLMNRKKREGDFTWEELAILQKSDVARQLDHISPAPNKEITTLEDYVQVMRVDTPNLCCWGDNLETRLIANMASVNIAVYSDSDNEERNCSVLSLRDFIEVDASFPTIFLLYTNMCTHYKAMIPNQKMSKKISSLQREIVEQLVLELKGLKLEDLKNLYHNVSKSLIERNGLVADFNILLTALMCCNTNSLFLGSKEQSQGALFYIGPYICKNAVQIIDSFDILLEAQEYAQKYPSSAEDSSSDKRFVQHVLTRVLNKMNSLMEISDTQAAVALLGMDAGMCSDIFVSYDANSYMSFVLNDIKYGEYGTDEAGEEDCRSFDNDDDNDSIGSFIVSTDDEGSLELVHNNGETSDEEQQSEDEFMLDENGKSEADCPFEISGFEGFDLHGKGYCPIYTVDDGKRLEAIPNPLLYRYRGRDLRMLSRYEYRTQVRIVKNSQDNEDTTPSDSSKATKGRTKAKAFQFAEGFELQPSHVQMLRVKLCTMKLYSNPPPFPGKQPEDVESSEYKKWKKKADKFGAYFLVLFRPEEDLYEKNQKNNYKYNWNAFVQFQHKLKNGSYFEQMRYRTMQGYMFGWRTNYRNRAILSHYRGRNRTIWSEEEKNEFNGIYGNNYHSKNKAYYDEDGSDDDDENNFISFTQLSSKQELNIMKNVSYSDDLVNFLRNVTRSFDEEGGRKNASSSYCEDRTDNPQTIVRPPNRRFASEILDDSMNNEIAEELETNTNENNNNMHRNTPQEEDVKVKSFLEKNKLSNDKSLAISVLVEHFKMLNNGAQDDYNAPVLVITGGPGVGKSFLVDVLDGVSKIMNAGQQLRMALYGVAAINIDGTSMHALMDIPIEFNKSNQQKIKPWNEDKLRNFKRLYDLDRISVIVVDEISTVKPFVLGYLNARLQEACCSDKPFGGKAIIMLGDFDQLPPAGGCTIPEVAMQIEREKYFKCGGLRRLAFGKKEYEITSVVSQGVEQFTRATLINLTEQHRSEDQEHTELLNRMSAGDSIGPEDLRNYKILCKEDKDFEFATILTPGNRERHEFNKIQSNRWAMKHGTNVIKWPKRERRWNAKPRNPIHVKRAKEQESCFWELFVAGACAYLTFNLNVGKGLGNGVPVRYDSISFTDKERQIDFENQLNGSSPGEEITLTAPPDFVNVELFPDLDGDSNNAKRKNAEKRKNWKYGSMTNDGRVVIPIEISNKKHIKWKKSYIRGGGGYRFRPSYVELADYFPIEPGFSVTIHKAQVRIKYLSNGVDAANIIAVKLLNVLCGLFNI